MTGELVRLDQFRKSHTSAGADESGALGHPDPIIFADQPKVTGRPMLDHRHDPKLPSMVQDVKPEGCPPRSAPVTRERMVTLLMPAIKGFVRELDSAIAYIRTKSSNRSDAIPRLVGASDGMKEWIRSMSDDRNVRRLFITQIDLLQYQIAPATKCVSDDWGEEEPVVYGLCKMLATLAQWLKELRPLE